jgi:hypothetical protein
MLVEGMPARQSARLSPMASEPPRSDVFRWMDCGNLDASRMRGCIRHKPVNSTNAPKNKRNNLNHYACRRMNESIGNRTRLETNC